MSDFAFIDSYIGIPYDHFGDGYEATNCYSLIRRVFKEQRGIDLPDWGMDDSSIKAAIAALWARQSTLKGGRILSTYSTISLLPIPYPIRSPANPYIFEKVLRMITLLPFLKYSSIVCGYSFPVMYS